MKDLIELLERALDDRALRPEYVRRFQETVWASTNLHSDPEIVRMIRDLAYDLDFFEADDRTRAEDPALYGDDRLEAEIRSVLGKLRS